jgi:2-iminobutanoate/2-iminopropanoate deaminase
LSGQQGADPTTGEFAQGGIRGETRQALENIKALLAVAGTDLAHVVKVNAYLSDIAEIDGFNEIYVSYFPSPPPTRTARQAQLVGGCRVEIDVIAEIP